MPKSSAIEGQRAIYHTGWQKQQPKGRRCEDCDRLLSVYNEQDKCFACQINGRKA